MFIRCICLLTGIMGLLFFPSLVKAQDSPVPVPVQESLPLPVTQEQPVADLGGVDEPAYDDGMYYDSESLVPSTEMGRKSGPSRSNPSLEPASKLIVVKKNYGAHAQQSQIVAAQRAMALGRYSSALEIYDRIYQTSKRDPNILLGRASSLQHVGREDEAIQAYQELLDIKPDNLEAKINMLGLMSRRYPAVALEQLNDLRQKNPGHAGIAAQLAVVNAELGRYDEAIQYLGVAYGLEPNNANHLYNMAVIADRGGHKTEAIKYYEKSLEVDLVHGGGKTIPRDSVFERLARLR